MFAIVTTYHAILLSLTHNSYYLRFLEVVDGTILMIAPLHSTSLLFLVGGGRSPRYPPNKVVFWDDAIGKEVAELEFRERVRGLACRREWLVVALRRRVVVFKFTNTIERIAEWDTSDNERGLSLFHYPSLLSTKSKSQTLLLKPHFKTLFFSS